MKKITKSDLFWYVFGIAKNLYKYGFSSYTLRFILAIFQDNQCSLAITLAFYDKLSTDADIIETTFNGKNTTVNFKRF